MVGLGIVLLVSSVTGSYALAGALTACYVVANAVAGPLGSRYVDRWGQRRVVGILVAVHASSLLVFVAAVLAGWPTAALAMASLLAGATQPATGALVRARWAVALGEHPSLRTAFAFESVLDELIFILGPPLATTLAVVLGAPAPLVVSVALVSIGSVLLLAQRKTEPQPVPRSPAGGDSLLSRPGVIPVVASMVAIGAVFGSVDVATVAAADEAGTRIAAGVVLALYAAGSMGAAVVLGARSHRRRDSALPRQLALAAAAVAVTSVAFPLATVVSAAGVVGGSLAWLGLVALAAGLSVSPVLITAFALLERLSPPARLTEALTWGVSGIALGVAIAAAVTGAVVERSGSGGGFMVTLVAGLLTLVCALIALPMLSQIRAGADEDVPRAEPRGH